MTPGIHLLHKPIGPTSFSLVQSCMEALVAKPSGRMPRICHGGTLDPFASGLLLILVEPATKLFDHLHAIPKTYDATVQWGRETVNGDLHGAVIFTGDASSLTPQQLDDALAKFVGWHDQIPHPTSAKRIDGERAYLKAHRGETVIMPPSRVYMHEATWLSHDLPRQSRLRMTVRGGYYVRALARDLGRMLGCGAHLNALHRSAIGPWTDPGPGHTNEIHGRELLPWAQTRILTDAEVGDLRQNRTIPTGELIPPGWPLPLGFPEPNSPIRGIHLEHFCFLLTPHEGQLRALSVLRGGL
jgi:tRNA pseudouridine55 synthase